MSLHIRLEFSGGAELLFNKVKTHDVVLPERMDKEPWNLRKLILWIAENLLQERSELFIQGDSVRSGILVMVNMTDWALLDGLEYCLEEGDEILFISTLHGG